MRNDGTHLVEQTWELVHQGQHVNPANSFLDSVFYHTIIVNWIKFSFV